MIPKFRAWHIKEKKIYRVNGLEWIGETLHSVHTPGHRFLSKYIILMLSTGLLDKNGKEVFEGDIVKRFDTDKGLAIIWNDAGFEFSEPTSFIFCQDLAGRHYEIIGDIHSNPELMDNHKDDK